MAAEEAVEHPYFQEVHSEFWSVSKLGIPIYKRLPKNGGLTGASSPDQ